MIIINKRLSKLVPETGWRPSSLTTPIIHGTLLKSPLVIISIGGRSMKAFFEGFSTTGPNGANGCSCHG